MELISVFLLAAAAFLSPRHLTSGAPVTRGSRLDLTALSQSQHATYAWQQSSSQPTGEREILQSLYPTAAAATHNDHDDSDDQEWTSTAAGQTLSLKTGHDAVLLLTKSSTETLQLQSSDITDLSTTLHLSLTTAGRTESDIALPESDIVLTAVNQENLRTQSSSEDDVQEISAAHALDFSAAVGGWLSEARHTWNILHDVSTQANRSFTDLFHDWCECHTPAQFCPGYLQSSSPEDGQYLALSQLPTLDVAMQGASGVSSDPQVQALLAIDTVVTSYTNFVHVTENGVLRSYCGSSCNDVSRCAGVSALPEIEAELRHFCQWRNLFLSLDGLRSSLYKMVASALPEDQWPRVHPSNPPPIPDSTNALGVAMLTLGAVAKELVKVRELMELTWAMGTSTS